MAREIAKIMLQFSRALAYYIIIHSTYSDILGKSIVLLCRNEKEFKLEMLSMLFIGLFTVNLPKQEGGTPPEISNSPSLQVAVSLPAKLYPV